MPMLYVINLFFLAIIVICLNILLLLSLCIHLMLNYMFNLNFIHLHVTLMFVSKQISFEGR